MFEKPVSTTNPLVMVSHKRTSAQRAIGESSRISIGSRPVVESHLPAPNGEP